MAGFPSPAQDYTTSEIDLTEHLMPNRVSSYLVRARGHSMTGAGIWDGDELIVDRSIRPQPGHVVIAVIDDELTVKRLHVRGGQVVLSPENPGYPDIVVPSLSDLKIWGVVTTCLHHVTRDP
ncbi:translesion error-prone DNA polymerase V autoproteolytic subunit (plasmid) [Citricoccus nitrophenolicus]